jgi:hypothetical protein
MSKLNVNFGEGSVQMSEPSSSHDDPRWLDEFEDMANRQLDIGSSCDQVHPIVANWLEKLIEGERPTSRPSVEQAMACLSREIFNQAPEELVDTLLQHIDEDELEAWIEHVLLIGRAFETSLHNGDLDDL